VNYLSLEWMQPNRLVEQALVARGGSTVYFGGATGDIIEFEGTCNAAEFAQLQTIRDYKRIVTFISDIVGQHYPTNKGLYVVVEDARFRERSGLTHAASRYYPYKFRLRMVGDLDNYKRATVAETTLLWHTFSMVDKPTITLPTGISSPSQTVTGTRTGENGTIPYLQNFKGNYLTYAATEADLSKNDVSIAWSGTELHMKNGLVGVDTRNDEASNTGLVDLLYWNPAGSAYALMGTIEVLAYTTAWESMTAQYPTIHPMVRNNSEYGAINLIWEQTSTSLGLIGELQLYRGRPFVVLKLTNYGIPTLKGVCVRLNLNGTAHRYWVPGTGATQDATSAAHGTPDTIVATANDAAYCYCMNTAAIGAASLIGGVLVRTKANGRSYAAYDAGNYWSYVDQRFDAELAELAPALQAAYWTVGAGWAAPAGTLNKNADGVGTAVPNPALTITAGVTYKVVITLSAVTVGTCSYTLGGVTGSSLAAATTYTDYITASTTGNLIFTPSAAAARFTISAVSVKALNTMNITTGNELEQFWIIARKYENANDNPSELVKEALAQVDQAQTVVKTT